MSQPTILVTNDDGIQAPGILALKQGLERLGRVIVIAPDRNWSAAGHTKTMHRPLRVESTRLADGSQAFACDGAPSDCVALAALGFVKDKIDLVVSGINHGPNLGDDITYSGTVAAAMEGSLAGIPSVAVSLDDYDHPAPNYATAAAVAVAVCVQVLSRRLAHDVILNVNVPNRPWSGLAGLSITRLGKRIYRDVLDARHDPENGSLYWIGGERPTGIAEPGTDIGAVTEGRVSITPIHLDLTDHKLMERLAGWEWISGK